MSNKLNVGRELLNVPFAEMVTGLAAAIAESQTRLDQESIRILRTMGDKEALPVTLPYVRLEDGKLTDADITTSMIGAGFQPTFYQFAETIIEVKMAITANYEESTEKEYSGKQTSVQTVGRRRVRITSTPVDATYTNKYNYTQEGASLLRTRLVPVPPNNIIQQQLDMRTQYMQMDFELAAAEQELALAQRQAQLEKELEKIR